MLDATGCWRLALTCEASGSAAEPRSRSIALAPRTSTARSSIEDHPQPRRMARYLLENVEYEILEKPLSLGCRSKAKVEVIGIKNGGGADGALLWLPSQPGTRARAGGALDGLRLVYVMASRLVRRRQGMASAVAAAAAAAAAAAVVGAAARVAVVSRASTSNGVAKPRVVCPSISARGMNKL